ncbi:MAG: undecaprenyl-diphosphate phosphatase [Patescibacteria group bacterium]|jgi:undecaprenyl-diphosphatase|nr:undecaprenyl-diphosphate phosphatase [Patescibacteria group bacterium]
MHIWQSVILGVVEGLTEFLPISSTAHLILTSEILKIPSSDFLKTFNISIQLGAILAVVLLYWKKIINSKKIIYRIITAFIPTAIIGFTIYGLAKSFLMDSLPLIASTLFLGGIILIIFEKRYKKKNNLKEISQNNESKKDDEDDKELEKITLKQSIIIGIVQSLAIIPGVSRSAATIIGGLSLGLSRKTIVEFSFLLAVPTMFGATFLDLYKSQDTILLLTKSEILVWIIGFVISFFTALIGIKFLLKYIKKNDFISFAWYRIGLGILIALFLFI